MHGNSVIEGMVSPQLRRQACLGPVGVGQHGGMPAGDDEESPRVRSWITPKAAKGGASAIEGRGVHAVEPIAAREVVAVKGGHIVDGSAVAALPGAIRDSAFPIAADCFLAALTPGEYDG
jgi:hypothetical protein